MLDFVGDGALIPFLGGHGGGGDASPLALFAGGVIGVWFDPSDRTTLYEDVAGTIPATLPGQPVGLMLDKSKGPVGPELIPNGSFSAGLAGIEPAYNSVLTDLVGSVRVSPGAVDGNGAFAKLSIPTVIGKTYWLRAEIKSMNGTAYVRAVNNPSSPWSALLAVASLSPTKLGGFFIATAAVTHILLGSSSSSIGHWIEYDNISLREAPGYHATQAVAASRPTLARHPKGGRRNLLIETENFASSAWFNDGQGSSPTIVSDAALSPNGDMSADRITLPDTGSGRLQAVSTVPSAEYTFSVWLRADTPCVVAIGGISLAFLNVNVTQVWQRFWVTQVAPADVRYPRIRSASGGEVVYAWGAQLDKGSVATPYQKVTSQYDVTESGVPDCWGLMFDGVDDFMVTPAIDLTGTDKVGVFAGVRKLSDAAIAVLAEFGTNSGTGLFYLSAPDVASGNYGFRSGGSLYPASSVASGYSAPITNVIAGLYSIGADQRLGRVNGVQVISNSADQGTGNFGNYPLYIGRRGGTSLPFNGILNELIVAGKLPSAAEITNTETFLNSKMGAY